MQLYIHIQRLVRLLKFLESHFYGKKSVKIKVTALILSSRSYDFNRTFVKAMLFSVMFKIFQILVGLLYALTTVLFETLCKTGNVTRSQNRDSEFRIHEWIHRLCCKQVFDIYRRVALSLSVSLKPLEQILSSGKWNKVDQQFLRAAELFFGFGLRQKHDWCTQFTSA